MAILMLDLLGVSIFGLVSAVLMTLVETPFWKKWGMEGMTEWQVNSVMVSKLFGKSKEINQPELSWTIASHLLHGVAAGIVVRLLLPTLFWLVPVSKMSMLLDAVVYSVALWAFFLVWGRRKFESVGRIQITSRGLLCSLLSMIVYGIFLGIMLPFTFP